MAISVYLDTQHISRAALGKSNVSAFLADSSLSFYFSATHIVECLPKSPVDNQQAVGRLSLIMSPQSKGLVGWGRVTELEKAHGQRNLETLACDVKHLLFPALAIDRSRWMRKIREGLKKFLVEEIFDPNLRRSFQAKVLKHGKLTPAAFEFLRAQTEKTAANLSASLPQALPLLDAGGVYDFLEGKVSERAFTGVFRDSLADPVKLASMAADPELSSIIDLSQILWTQMAELQELISKLVNRLAKAQVGFGEKAYASIRSLAIDQLKSGEFRCAVLFKFSGVKIDPSLLDHMPGSRLLVEVFSEYVLEKIDTFANPRSKSFGIEPKFKRSDAADLVHLVYCPYVDVFGCDSGMRDRIRRAGWPVTNVVTNDAELEALIAAKKGRTNCLKA